MFTGYPAPAMLEAAVSDSEAACDMEAARGGATWLAAARELLKTTGLDEP